MGMRTLTGWLRGAKPDPSESVFWVFWGEYHRRVTELAVDILGAEVMHIEGMLPNTAARTDGPIGRTRTEQRTHLEMAIDLVRRATAPAE